MKKYTLTFFIMSINGDEKLESVDCDQWVEVAEDTSAIIYCLNNKKDWCIGYPSSNLRKIEQNKDILNNMGNFLHKKIPEGYN